MNRFPQAMFIAGGQETIEGRQFTSKMVNDADELDAALAAGWHPTTDEAAATEDAAKRAADAAADKLAEQSKKADDEHDSAPPTRAELEQKATELGVEFSPKLGDKKLAERIADKLAEQQS